MKAVLICSLVLGAAALRGWASDGVSGSSAAVDRLAAVAAFAEQNPRALMYRQGDRTARVYGIAFSEGASAVDSAERFVEQHVEMFGVPVDHLEPGSMMAGGIHTQPVMYDPATGEYKFTLVMYAQRVAGIPVYESDLRLLVRNNANYPLVMASNGLKDLGAFWFDADRLPDVNEGKAKAIARLPNRGLTDFSEAELVIWAGTYEQAAEARLAVTFVGENDFPEAWRFVADAESGLLLHQENLMHRVDLPGNVSGIASDTVNWASPYCEDHSVHGLPYAAVTIQGQGTVYTDVNGDFVFPDPGDEEVTVTSPVAGQYFVAENYNLANSELELDVTPPGPADLLHNDPDSEFTLAEVDGYIHANVVRDHTLLYNPDYPAVSTQSGFPVWVNRTDGFCPGNAWYSSTSQTINFCRSTPSWPNTAFSSIVYHEYGHRLVNAAGSGQCRYGEGMSDCIDVLISDTPELALGFYGEITNPQCNTSLRDADNNQQYPCTSGCHGCAPLLSGCIWDTRNALLATNPETYRDILSSLTINSILLRSPGDSEITPTITLDFLILDDDDENLYNETPHWDEITAGFGAHNMLPELPILLEFDYPEGRPFFVSPSEPTEVVVEIIPAAGQLDPNEDPLLHVSVDGGPYTEIPLTPSGESNGFIATIPQAPCFALVNWYISAITDVGIELTSPAGAPDDHWVSLVVTGTTTIAMEDFENPVGYEITGSVTLPQFGLWENDVPVEGGIGSPESDFDGSGKCYVTGNLPGLSDVDFGETILNTPQIDMSAGAAPYFIGYARWFYNLPAQGDSDPDDFVVEVSNDDGDTWHTLEAVPEGPEGDGGWFEVQHLINSIVEPTDEMRFRFIAADLGTASQIEAGIDALSITVGVCDDPGAGPFIVHDNGSTTQPFSGYVDPRAESSNGVDFDLGVDALTIRFSEPVFPEVGLSLTPENFEVTGTGSGHPSVIAVDSTNNPVVELTLSGPIPVQEWTTVRALDIRDSDGNGIINAGNQGPGVDELDRVDVGFLPADVDQSGDVTPFDLLEFRQIVNDVVDPSQGSEEDYADIDRSGTIEPFDLLVFRQLVNGAGNATQSWSGETITTRP